VQLLLSRDILEQFDKALRSGGSREIGGLLFGEHVGDEMFRVVEITVQLKDGTFGDFVRDPAEHNLRLRENWRRPHTLQLFRGVAFASQFPSSPEP